MTTVVVTLTIPDWFVERLGNPDPAALGRRVLEALVADCLRSDVATVAEVPGWLDLDGPGALDAFLKAHGIATEGVEVRDGT